MVLYNQTAVSAEEYVGRLVVSEKKVTLHAVRMKDEGSFTVLDREGKVRRRNCLNVRGEPGSVHPLCPSSSCDICHLLCAFWSYVQSECFLFRIVQPKIKQLLLCLLCYLFIALFWCELPSLDRYLSLWRAVSCQNYFLFTTRKEVCICSCS